MKALSALAVAALLAGCATSPPVDAYYNEGLTRLEAGDRAAAREALEQALALDPDDIDARYRYGLLCAEAGDYTRAIGHLEHAAKLDERNADLWIDLAIVYNNARMFDASERALNVALALDANRPEPYFYHGLLLYQRGERDKARRMFRHALHVAPTYARAADALRDLF